MAGPPVSLDVPAEATTRTVGGVDLHVVVAGDPADLLVVLLHRVGGRTAQPR